tara:strand:+ start:291 stop:515 length:225 start_codon:yes stop_codon:yes gene_type:complete
MINNISIILSGSTTIEERNMIPTKRLETIKYHRILISTLKGLECPLINCANAFTNTNAAKDAVLTLIIVSSLYM